MRADRGLRGGQAKLTAILLREMDASCGLAAARMKQVEALRKWNPSAKNMVDLPAIASLSQLLLRTASKSSGVERQVSGAAAASLLKFSSSGINGTGASRPKTVMGFDDQCVDERQPIIGAKDFDF